MRDGEVQSAGMDADVDRRRLAELVAVELHRVGGVGGELDAGAAGVAHRVVFRAQAQDAAARAEAAQDAVVPGDAAPDGEPADGVLGLEDDDVEFAVGDRGLRDEFEAGREGAAVGEQDALDVGAVHPVAGDLVHEGERLRADEGARGSVDVGDPADLLLEVTARVGDHRGIQPHAAHHDEGALLALAVLAHELGEADVYRADVALERRRDHRLRVGQGQSEIAREQVAGAAGDDREGDAGVDHRLADGADRAVAAGDEHRCRARLEGFAGDAVAEIVHRRLIEEGLAPPGTLRVRRHGSAQGLRLDLRRVVDERRAALGGLGGSGAHAATIPGAAGMASRLHRSCGGGPGEYLASTLRSSG